LIFHPKTKQNIFGVGPTRENKNVFGTNWSQINNLCLANGIFLGIFKNYFRKAVKGAFG